jgi:O-antigen/teichoic acid export membrane protein
LLGLSKAKTILVLDIAGTALKFGSALAFISLGYGASGILLSFLIQAVVITCGTTIAGIRFFGIGFGDLSFIKEIVKDGLVNMPSKLSGLLVISLSVVMLASSGVESSEVGVFYIAMMVSIVVGSFASSLAFMSIPASSALHKDLSSGSLRIGLAFTAPIISALIVAPSSILSIIGPEYAAAAEVLVVLAAGVLPSVILSNAMSKFNNQNKPKNLLAIGSLRIGVFLIAFSSLVPQFGTLGAAYAILASFSSAAVLSTIWSERTSLRFIGISILSIVAGVFSGTLVSTGVQAHPVFAIITSLSTALLIIFSLRCTSTKEIVAVIGAIRKAEKK